MSNSISFPKFDVPAFSDAEVAFGASEKHYLGRSAIPAEFYNGRHAMCDVASSLFFKGGKLADHGIKFKDDIDQLAAMKAIRALLGSWAPKHEIKIGTVGIALANWCEPIEGEK